MRGVCALFLLYLSGAAAQLSATGTSCAGQEVTYTCTVPAIAHRWTIHTLPDPVAPTIDRSLAEVTVPPYSFQTVSDDGTTIITSATVTAFPELNGTVISCVDGNARPGQGGMQETTAMVFGRPSAPGLSVVAVNLTTFNFTISPPSVASQCVLNYTITTSGDADINVDAPTTVTESGFDLCSNTYNFTVVANTLTGPGETSRIIDPEDVDFLTPMLDLNFSEFSVMIIGMAPENSPSFADSTVSIQRSSPKSSSCEESVLNQMTSGSSPVTEMETLNCRYAGCNVTYCLQFSTEECMSIVVMNTTELPSLLSSPLQVTSSTDSISLRWDVHEQANCEGVDGLTINVTISEGATAIRTEEADFADGTITFEFRSARDYTCSVTVVFGNESIESSQAACGITAATTTTDDSGGAPIGPVVGGVVGGAAVLIIVVAVVVLVLILVLKKSNDKGDDETATELKPAQTYRPVADDKPSAAPAAMYADPPPAPAQAPRGIGSVYPADNEPVVYSTLQ